MILNGLGFHSRTLHMFPGFFADKPTERLIGPGILPEHLNDDTLGRCLDALYETNVSILMIYAALEHRIRTGLKAHNQTFPDMKKKPCQNPTARWVFLCFSGLHELTVGEGPPLVVNLQPRQQVIIDVLGERYRRLYS